MVHKTIDNFDLAQICQSGQCFRMQEIDGGRYSLTAGAKYLKLWQQGKECFFDCEKEEYETFWKGYFDLEENYAALIDKINPNDSYLTSAAAFGSGIRILRQDLWEMIVSFLISQQNNIVRIRRCIQNICECYGEKLVDERSKTTYYAFPSPKALAGLHEDALKECNLGYRSKYVVRAAKSVVSGEINLDKLHKLSYPQAKEKLLEIYGIGEKVADCVCLFALHHLQAFPVDTHINQAVQKYYKQGFPKLLYQGYEGVMQQYIFYYELYGKTGEI